MLAWKNVQLKSTKRSELFASDLQHLAASSSLFSLSESVSFFVNFKLMICILNRSSRRDRLDLGTMSMFLCFPADDAN